MATVVVTGWDAATRRLRYVPVNQGSGGAEQEIVVPGWYASEMSEQCVRRPLPQVGELEGEDDDCLIELTGPMARRCRARPHRGGMRLTDPDTGREVTVLAPAALGLPNDPVTVQRADRIGDFLLFAATGPVAGCWVRPGGLSGWLAEEKQAHTRRAAENVARHEREREREREQERRRLQERREAPDRFVNPYTFVPLPARIERCAPSGHERLEPGRLSGRMSVRWEFTAPVQVPDIQQGDGVVRFPGASVKGVVRSMHEALAGGCLRVLDEQFVPSYRDTAAALSSEWTLAVVTQQIMGQPLRVRTADTVVWVRSEQLIAACGPQLRTGSRVSFTPPGSKNSLGRYELAEDAPVHAGGDWVVLLTDAGARPKKRRNGEPALYFAACGRIPASVHGDTDEQAVDEAAWRTFRTAVEDARERVQNPDPDAPAPWVDVLFRDRFIGRRRTLTGWFTDDDVLWVRRSANRVTALRPSVIWRHPGTGALGERVPASLLACTDPTLLCPSCRLFGAADTRSRTGGPAEQRAYAGHIRFGDAVSAGPVTVQPFRRAPLGVPRPGAGQFYLNYSEQQRGPARSETERPTREWGARPDLNGLRPVRGRKFYWHTEPGAYTARHEARPHHRPQVVADKRLAPAGTVLEQTITFDNLAPAEIGALLAALRPQQVLPGTGDIRLHLGGGKPLGLGSCRVAGLQVTVWDAASRYGDGPATVFNPEETVGEFVRSCPAEVTATWPALAAVLTAGTVNPERVWYPPGVDWPDRATDPRRFDEPFAFFTVTSGMFLQDGEPRPLLPLPDPTGPDQSLPIIHKGHTKHRPEERWT